MCSSAEEVARIRFLKPEPEEAGETVRVWMGDVCAVKRKESVKVAGSDMEFLSVVVVGGLGGDSGMETMKPWRVFS